MPVQPGARLGPYEITSAIGAGGVGEVHRARDPALNHPNIAQVYGLEQSGDTPAIVRG